MQIAILKAMENQKIITQVREVLALYDSYCDEWLNSKVCFLDPTETKAIGYLLAFQSVEESSRLLAVSPGVYLDILDHTLEKLKNQHFRYLGWVNSQFALSN